MKDVKGIDLKDKVKMEYRMIQCLASVVVGVKRLPFTLHIRFLPSVAIAFLLL